MRTYAGTLERDDGQWVRATKDYVNTRYSTLDQINTGNVASLKLHGRSTPAEPADRKLRRLRQTIRCTSSHRGRHLVRLDLAKPSPPLKWR
jgi:lanthanide-dependent methanol dehydrogenase